MRISSVCFVLFLRLLTTWLGPVVTWIRFSVTAGDTTWVSFAIWFKASSVGFVEDAVQHVGLFFVAQKAGGQRFIVDVRASNRHFWNPLLLPALPFP